MDSNPACGEGLYCVGHYMLFHTGRIKWCSIVLRHKTTDLNDDRITRITRSYTIDLRLYLPLHRNVEVVTETMASQQIAVEDQG